MTIRYFKGQLKFETLHIFYKVESHKSYRMLKQGVKGIFVSTYLFVLFIFKPDVMVLWWYFGMSCAFGMLWCLSDLQVRTTHRWLGSTSSTSSILIDPIIAHLLTYHFLVMDPRYGTKCLITLNPLPQLTFSRICLNLISSILPTHNNSCIFALCIILFFIQCMCFLAP